MRVDLESVKGKIDFGIISIREDEFLAVLERFAPDSYALGNQRYEIGSVRSKGGGHYNFAAVRLLEQGQAQAQKVATDLIGDLAPRWLLVVGIGGAVPSMDFTLGDVVCATRVHDFSVRAVKEGATDTYNAGGGPMHPEIQRLLASLPAIVTRQLGEWNSPEAVGTPKPSLRVPVANSNRYYGDEKWKAELRHTLLHHFPSGQPPRRPLVTSRSVATSDALVKSTELLSQWQQHARGVAAVEMELGGVYLAARGIGRDHPILAIRGISDIVGFRREEQWTKYACATAAAFAYALIWKGEPFEARVSPKRPGAPLTAVADWLCRAAEEFGRFAGQYAPELHVAEGTEDRAELQAKLVPLRLRLTEFTDADLEEWGDEGWAVLIRTSRASALRYIGALDRILRQEQDADFELRQLVASLAELRDLIHERVHCQDSEDGSLK
jgi:nucleoside phosphorylase